jgi:hypothetical protein
MSVKATVSPNKNAPLPINQRKKRLLLFNARQLSFSSQSQVFFEFKPRIRSFKP